MLTWDDQKGEIHNKRLRSAVPRKFGGKISCDNGPAKKVPCIPAEILVRENKVFYIPSLSTKMFG